MATQNNPEKAQAQPNQVGTLTLALKKALDNGWKPSEFETGTDKDKARYALKITKPSQLWGLVLTPEFAEAMWGNDYLSTKEVFEPHIWQYHLKQLVVLSNDERLKYLDTTSAQP